MKKMFGIVAILALIVGGIMVLNKTDDSQLPGGRTATKLTFSIVQNEVNAGTATLLDVRTAEEFASGHFAGATNLSLQEIEAGRLPDSVKTQRLYVYCRSGNRSAQATTLLK
ncbi:rhodanese-like domain-containing protein, partial [Candidatus Saccharibacteria bacterium]|nr:rhodanese-like domain-containing protein [Candidatus Saccharibacteria bacterium]